MTVFVPAHFLDALEGGISWPYRHHCTKILTPIDSEYLIDPNGVATSVAAAELAYGKKNHVEACM